MYGGKFYPFHTGHMMCITHAAEMCDKLYVILFVNGEFERSVNANGTKFKVDKYLSTSYRVGILHKIGETFDNVYPIVINVNDCVKSDGSEDWDAETPLVCYKCGIFDYVFSSEPSYDEYFKRAYPWAKHILIDPPRKIVPISATMIRNMNLNDAKEWIVNE